MFVFEFLNPEDQKKRFTPNRNQADIQNQTIPPFAPSIAPQPNNIDIKLDVTQQKLTLISDCIFHAPNVLEAKTPELKAKSILDNIEARSTELEAIIPDSFQHSLNESLSHLIEQVTAGADPRKLRLSLGDGCEAIVLDQDLMPSLPATVFSRIDGDEKHLLQNGRFLRQVQQEGMDYVRGAGGYSEEEALAANRFATKHYKGSVYAPHTVNPQTNEKYQQEVWGHYFERLDEYIAKYPPKSRIPPVEMEAKGQTGEEMKRTGPADIPAPVVELKIIQLPIQPQFDLVTNAQRAATSGRKVWIRTSPTDIGTETFAPRKDGIWIPSAALEEVGTTFQLDISDLDQKLKENKIQLKLDIALDTSGSMADYANIVPQIASVITDNTGGNIGERVREMVNSPEDVKKNYEQMKRWKDTWDDPKIPLLYINGVTKKKVGNTYIDEPYKELDAYLATGPGITKIKDLDADNVPYTLGTAARDTDVLILVTDGSFSDQAASLTDVRKFLETNPNTRVVTFLVASQFARDHPLNGVLALQALAQESGGQFVVFDEPLLKRLGNLYKNPGPAPKIEGALAADAASFNSLIMKTMLGTINQKADDHIKSGKSISDALKRGDMASFGDLIMGGTLPLDIATQAIELGLEGNLAQICTIMETKIELNKQNGVEGDPLALRWNADLDTAVQLAADNRDGASVLVIVQNTGWAAQANPATVGNLMASLALSGNSAVTLSLLANPDIAARLDLDNPGLLMAAVRNNDETLFWGLADAGFDLNAPSESGRTAIGYFAQRGNDAMVKKLMERGADPSLKDAEGKSAIDYAQEGGLPSGTVLNMQAFVPTEKKEGVLDKHARFSTADLIEIDQTLANAGPFLKGKIASNASQMEEPHRAAVRSILGDVVILNSPHDPSDLELLAYGIRAVGDQPDSLGLSYLVTGPNLNPAQFYNRRRGDCGDFVTLFAYLAEYKSLAAPEDICLIAVRGVVEKGSKTSDPDNMDGHMTAMVRSGDHYYLTDMVMGPATTWIDIGTKRPTDTQLCAICQKYIEIAGATLKPGTVKTDVFHGWKEFMDRAGTPMQDPIQTIAKKNRKHHGR